MGFKPTFDWAISCMTVDNLLEKLDLLRALRGMRAVLKPGGECYLRLRNLAQVLEDRPRYEFRGERTVPYGRVISLEDWEFPDEGHIIHIDVYLREDTRHPDYWDTDYLAYQRRALCKADLERLLHQASLRSKLVLNTVKE